MMFQSLPVDLICLSRMPFYRDSYKATITLGKALHSLMVCLGKQMSKSFQLFQLFCQTERELAIHG